MDGDGGQDSPGTIGKGWFGSFDFSAFNKMISLVTQSVKTKGENAINPSSEAAVKAYAEIAKKVRTHKNNKIPIEDVVKKPSLGGEMTLNYPGVRTTDDRHKYTDPEDSARQVKSFKESIREMNRVLKEETNESEFEIHNVDIK